MIVVIANWEVNKRGERCLVTSHGVDDSTMRNVVLPNIHPAELGATFNENMGEWTLD